MSELKVPKSGEERVGKESVSAAPNPGAVIEAQPVVDAGANSGPGFWSGDGAEIKFKKS